MASSIVGPRRRWKFLSFFLLALAARVAAARGPASRALQGRSHFLRCRHRRDRPRCFAEPHCPRTIPAFLHTNRRAAHSGPDGAAFDLITLRGKRQRVLALHLPRFDRAESGRQILLFLPGTMCVLIVFGENRQGLIPAGQKLRFQTPMGLFDPVPGRRVGLSPNGPGPWRIRVPHALSPVGYAPESRDYSALVVLCPSVGAASPRGPGPRRAHPGAAGPPLGTGPPCRYRTREAGYSGADSVPASACSPPESLGTKRAYIRLVASSIIAIRYNRSPPPSSHRAHWCPTAPVPRHGCGGAPQVNFPRFCRRPFHRLASILHGRTLSRLTAIWCFWARYSAARVGPKP
jgi:hypothetical protein